MINPSCSLDRENSESIPQRLPTEAALLLRRQPGLGHGTFDDVPLNPSAMRASECSQVLARTAWLNRRQPHWRTASRALGTLVLPVEHGIASIRRCEFSGKPTCRPGFEGIRCNDGYLNVIAPGAFEQPAFEATWPR